MSRRKAKIPYPPAPKSPGADVPNEVYAAYKRAYSAWDDMIRAVRWVSSDTPSDPVYRLRQRDENFRQMCDAAVSTGNVAEARRLETVARARW